MSKKPDLITVISSRGAVTAFNVVHFICAKQMLYEINGELYPQDDEISLSLVGRNHVHLYARDNPEFVKWLGVNWPKPVDFSSLEKSGKVT